MVSRTGGKRPDGVTLIPWQRGKPLAWDVTVVQTLTDSYVGATELSPGSIAEMAAERKNAKYVTLPDTITFQPVAFETLWQINQTGVEFSAGVGHRPEIISHDAREQSFLYLRLSLTVQRFSAVAFRGCFADERDT